LLDATRPADALDRIGEGIFGLDHDGRFAYANRKAQTLLQGVLGIDPPELPGTVIWERAPALGDTAFGWALRRAADGGAPVVAALRDAGGGPVEARIYPSPDGLFVLLLESPATRDQDLLDQISDIYLACDHDWRLTLLNATARGYLRQVGREPGELLGRNVWEALPALAGSRFQTEAFRAAAEQSEVEFEALFAPFERWFAVRITPMPEGIVASARDVTGARRRERALARETERLAAVIDTQHAVATAGPDLGAVMRAVTDRLQRLTGARAAGIFLPEDGELILCEASGPAAAHLGLRLPLGAGLVGRAYGGGQILRSDDCRTDARADDGVARLLEARSAIAVPLAGAGGVQAVVALWSDRARAFDDLKEQTVRLVAGLLAAAMEQAGAFAAKQLLLTERTVALAALREGEERFRTLIESIDDVVFRLDRGQRCVDAFGRWLAREGYRAENLLGRTTREIFGPADAAVHERANRRALAGETVTYEWTRSSARGVRHMQTTLSPQRGGAGQVIGIVGVGRDITGRIEAEQQLRQAQKMEAVGRFAGGVAHDLNNMMTIIIGFSDFLLSTLERADPRHSDTEEIRKAAERAMHLTRQLLGFGRRRLVARRVVDLNDVLSGMERMLRPLLGEDIELEIGPAAGLGGIEADYGQMEQVMMNLVLNARDAMPRGGRLRLETRNVELAEGEAQKRFGVEVPAGSYVMLLVSDTGHGMTDEVKTHLFEPFYTTKPATQNTGLGLTTVYGIVVQSGGYLWVDSEPGQGARFHFCFPRTAREEAEAGASRAAPPAGGSETVLVVEDEDAVRALALRALREQGYRVLEARNGREALELAAAAPSDIDLVVTDVVMPEMGGRELVERLADIRPTLSVIYMSGYTEFDKLQPGILDPGIPFLQKPFSAESLALRVRESLDRAARGT
jgi:PAS domain S-box-containing protein